MKQVKFGSKQAGVTLIELIVGLIIIGLIVSGALGLFSSAESSQGSTRMLQDVTALRSNTKGLFLGQGTYGAAGTNLNNLLVTAKRVPNTIKVDTSTTPNTLTHQLNGTVNITSAGGGQTFQLALTSIPADICIPLMTSAQSWISVQAGSAAARTTFPITPTIAAADCATGTTMTFVGN
jgi:prepilin-type N-terminal cleavage/methylation domain-containing protein